MTDIALRHILALVGMAVLPAVALAEGDTVKKSVWNGYEEQEFVVDGRACLLVLPKTPAPGKPWAWRTEFFGHEPQGDIALLGKGFHVAYMDVQNMYGAPVALDHMDKFYAHLTKTYGLSAKTVLEGFSRGGLFAFNWAARNPEKVAALYVDAPVCDFKSWPGGKGRGQGSKADWERCLKVYGLTEEQALAYQLNPVDNLEPLAQAGIPILSVCGEADTVVPIDENSRLVKERYEKLGGSMTLIAKPFCDHHPHSLKDPARIVNFILRHTPGCDASALLEEKTPYGYDYFQVRDGLVNCRLKMERQKKARVAFLGGSITAGAGWRDLVCASLRKRFPQTEFDFIAAGISSLGSTPDAFRFRRDVLMRGPVDLLFVEAAVNDETNGQTPVEMVRGMEGVVRQARLANPQMDLIMLHFVDPDKMKVINEGKTPVVIACHEKVAEYYGVPSIDLAREVTERIHAGEFSWEKDFKGLHPAPFGQALYNRSIQRLLDEAWKQPLPAEASLKNCRMPAQPLDEKSYFRGRLVDLKQAVLGDGWAIVPDWKPTDEAGTRAGFVHVPALVSEKPGAELRLRFEGTAVGIFVAAGPDAGTVDYNVDGAPLASRNLYTEWSGGLHLPWAQVLSADLEPGPHEMVLRVSPESDPRSKGHAVRIIHFLVNGSHRVEPGEMAGYLLVPVEKVPPTYNAGFSLYVAAWPLLQKYPGHRFQTGLFGTWMHAQYEGPAPAHLYSDIEGGLGWWRDTRFATETPKFVMGGVAPNFVAWANGPGAGKGRDWDNPKGQYGIAHLSPWLLWPPDGLNLKQGTCGELFGYGYLPLPLIPAQATTAGKSIPTGDNCWTLFLNTQNFKGPVAFFTPYFWSHAAVAEPRLAGLLLDTRPAGPNRPLQMETQYVPGVQATDDKGRTYARIAPTSFPGGPGGNSVVVHRVTSYTKKALWDAVKAWFEGGAPASGVIDPAGACVHRFTGKGGATWRIYTPAVPKEQRVSLAWSSFATPAAFDPSTFGYRWNHDLTANRDSQDRSLVRLPEYFHLVTDAGRKPQWVATLPKDVPAETGLAQVSFPRPRENRPEPYVTPDDPASCWKKPGPAAGPFQAHLGDGSVVTYYWYRFADQPALLNADLTDQERENLQARVEKLHRNWKRDRDYLAPPTIGKLASLDPALIVTPPPGLEVGYVPIATRQAAEP